MEKQTTYLAKSPFIKSVLSIILISTFTLNLSCVHRARLNVFQKNVPIPDHAWEYRFHPSFTFKITDTSARYSIFVTVRHTNEYPYSNLWLLVSSNFSGVKPKTQRVELPLADEQGQWLGSGMGDIFEHRIPIQENARFNKAGAYHFSFEQNMRINPLPHIMSIGLRVEKNTP